MISRPILMSSVSTKFEFIGVENLEMKMHKVLFNFKILIIFNFKYDIFIHTTINIFSQ